MYVDASLLPDSSDISADLAIIGAGAAGITLAREMRGRRTRVCLIEAGGRTYDTDTQALYDGENTGIAYPLSGSRMRMFGGSTNHWGGYCRALDPIDLTARDWVPNSGWPIGFDELLTYYPKACEIVEVGPARFGDHDYWEARSGTALPDMPSGRMDLTFVQFSPPTHFGERYGDTLDAAANIEILLNANVTEIVASEDARAVERIDIATLNGLRHRVRADTVVLATGGLENPRLLLLSDSVMPQGLGNRHDLVGRYFMEHPHLSGFGEIVVGDIDRLPPIYHRRTVVDGHNVSAAFIPSERHLRERRLYNATFMVGAGGKTTADAAGWHPNATGHRDVLRATARLIEGGRPVAANDDVVGTWLGIGCACEQAPNPDSRVSLGSERDALGLRRLRLAWRLTEKDRHSLVAHVRNLAMEFAAMGLGRMRIDIDDPGSWPDVVAGGSHHMGTTRMHDDPRQGVVDRNCRVHGLDNLYVAGGSVFPTGGAANPTLTIVALTLRLAEHLKARGL